MTNIRLLRYDYLILIISALYVKQSFCFGPYNYPEDKEKIKTCSKGKYIVQTELPICVPNDKGGFKEDTVKNCEEGKFKEECPEFGDRECCWYEFTWDVDKTRRTCAIGAKLRFPACKQWYKARSGINRYTWIEVFYVNQFGTKGVDGLFPIVEMDRNIKKTEVFPDQQEQWPTGVADYMGYAGIKWSDLPPPTIEALGKKLGDKKFCENGREEGQMCQKDIKDFYIKEYSEGNGLGGTHGFIKDESVIATCSKIVRTVLPDLKIVVVDTCRLKFTKVEKNKTIVYLEAAVYREGTLLNAKYSAYSV